MRAHHGGVRGRPLGFRARWPRSARSRRSTTTSPRSRSLADVVAPPYDVIDAGAAGGAARPLAVQRRRARPAARRPRAAIRYEHAAETLEEWSAAGRPRRRPRAGDLGADPGLQRPRRRPRAPAAASSPGSGVDATTAPGLVRPHERTQPGPEGGPPAPHPRHPPQPLADLLPARRRRLAPRRARTRGEPWGEVTDDDGTDHRVWRVADPAVHEAVAAELADAGAADRRRPPPLRDRARLRRRGRRRGPAPLHADGARLARGPRA